MTTATVRYITNGSTVNWQGSQAIGVPASLYAAQLPEAVYWLSRIFDPVAQPTAPAPAQEGVTQAQQDVEKRANFFSQWKEKLSKPEVSQRVVENEDPLLGQQAQVIDIASGGFLVSQFPNVSPTAAGMRIIETYCVDMDAVHGQLNIIFAPPAPAPSPEPTP